MINHLKQHHLLTRPSPEMKTNRLVLHTCEDDVEHLRERGFGCGLVDKVATGQVDVVAGPDGEKNRTLVDLYMWRGDRGQQGLVRETEGGQHFIQGSNAKGISFDSLVTLLLKKKISPKHSFKTTTLSVH